MNKIIYNPTPAQLFVALMAAQGSAPDEAIQIRLTTSPSPPAALGLYDTLNMFKQLDIEVVIFGGIAVQQSLVVAAAVEKRSCVGHTNLIFREYAQARGMLADLKIIMAAQNSLKDRTAAIIELAYGISQDEQRRLRVDGDVITTDYLVNIGLKIWENN